LKEFGDKISADKRAPIEEGLKKLKDAYAAKNFTDIEVAQTELSAAWNVASEEMYKATADAGQGQPGGNGAGPQGGAHAEGGNADTVTDVDFEEVK
jgi:molecular chaperone DnaK